VSALRAGKHRYGHTLLLKWPHKGKRGSGGEGERHPPLIELAGSFDVKNQGLMQMFIGATDSQCDSNPQRCPRIANVSLPKQAARPRTD